MTKKELFKESMKYRKEMLSCNIVMAIAMVNVIICLAAAFEVDYIVDIVNDVINSMPGNTGVMIMFGIWAIEIAAHLVSILMYKMERKESFKEMLKEDETSKTEDTVKE